MCVCICVCSSLSKLLSMPDGSPWAIFCFMFFLEIPHSKIKFLFLRALRVNSTQILSHVSLYFSFIICEVSEAGHVTSVSYREVKSHLSKVLGWPRDWDLGQCYTV